jgi:hypothetical protein
MASLRLSIDFSTVFPWLVTPSSGQVATYHLPSLLATEENSSIRFTILVPYSKDMRAASVNTFSSLRQNKNALALLMPLQNGVRVVGLEGQWTPKRNVLDQARLPPHAQQDQAIFAISVNGFS